MNEKPKLKLFETFAGIGSQHKALTNLEKYYDFETDLVGIAEWDVNSMSVYNRIHNLNIKEDLNKLIAQIIKEDQLDSSSKDLYQKDLKKSLINRLEKLRENGFEISNDTKSPIKNLNALKTNKLLETYSAILNLNNFTTVSILKDKVKEIQNIDVFTYSFPCQAISLQGKQEGLVENSGTSSSLLWSIRDFLEQIYLHQLQQIKNNFDELIELPKYLLMENVAALYNPKNKVEWDRFKNFLNNIGYSTEEVILKASNFGIPQNRDRAFALSVLRKNKTEKEIEGLLSNFKNLENEKKTLQMIDSFLTVKHLDSAKLMNLLIEEEYQVQKEKFKDSHTTKNHIKKIVLDNYTTFQSENMVYHSKESVSPTITAQGAQSRIKIYDVDLDVIRYMTAQEHLKLMGFEDGDYFNIIDNQKQDFVVSEVLIKKMAGNSIVVNVLQAIFEIVLQVDFKCLK